MRRSLYVLIVTALFMTPAALRAADASPGKAIYDKVSPSLVAVEYTWETELGRRELTGAGVVVSDEGLVMVSIGFIHTSIPDAQMTDFKIIVPQKDGEPDEVEAELLGRDERTDLAFVKAKSASASTQTTQTTQSTQAAEKSEKSEPRKWTAIKFEEKPLVVGEPVYSVGVLPKEAGYKTYLTEGIVGAQLRGPVPFTLVSGGGLAAVGSPVFNAEGTAIGFVNYQETQRVFLNDPRDPMSAVSNPPKFFVPTRDFALSLENLPKAGEQMKLPWLGVPQNAMGGLNEDVAEALGLKNVAAVELGDVLEGSPAAKAGLNSGDIVLEIDGEAIERGDSPDELPEILIRKIRRKNVGDTVKLSIFGGKDEPPKEVAVELTERPKGPNLAERYWAEDLGFAVREIVFMDTYMRKLPTDAKGVVVALLKPNGSAQSAELQMNDMITEMNGTAVEGISQFKETYEAFRKDKPREAVVLVVRREAGTQVIRIEPPQ